jgi:hypothetical protein
MLNKKMNDDGTFSIPKLEEWRLENREGVSGQKPRMRKFRFVEEGGGCWRCVSHLSRNSDGQPEGKEGYAIIKCYEECDEGKKQVSWLLTRIMAMVDGEMVTDETNVLHRCDHPWCCNPQHLYLGDHKDNARDRTARNRESYLHRQKYMPVAHIMFIRDNPQLSHVTLAKTLGCSFIVISDIRLGKKYRKFAYEPRHDGKKWKTKRVALPFEYQFGEAKASSWKRNAPGPKEGSKNRTSGYSSKDN